MSRADDNGDQPAADSEGAIAMTTEERNRVLDQLHNWEQEQGSLADVARLCRELLDIQNSEVASVSMESLHSIVDSPKNTSAWLSEGQPLVTFDRFHPDWDQVQRMFASVAKWVARDKEVAKGEAEGLLAIALDRKLLREVVGNWYSGRTVHALTRECGVDAELLAAIVSAVTRPFLEEYAAALSEKVDQAAWGRRYCPVCGGKPDFAYLHEDDGARWLVCSRCDSRWRFSRVGCPHCGNDKQDDLFYFAEKDGLSKYRLYVCERCRSYIKTVDLRHAGSRVSFPLERLTTRAMDRQAVEEGYQAVTP